MKITILNMTLLNFKGTCKRSIEFGPVTSITGDNETGKTTIFDAFTWLLFGKNSEDAKDFNVKTLDKDNQPIHKLEHEVNATLDVDGREIKLRRVFKEKWVKKRGEETAEFTGHETLFFIDDVPLNQKEYQARVDFIINENLAKLITNPLYFNQLKWQDRRVVLEKMAGAITNEEIAGDNQNFIKLLSQLGDASLIDFKKKISAKKNLIKENLVTIPTRIDEAKRSMPEVQDYAAIEKKIAEKQKEIEKIELAMDDKTKAYEEEYKAIQKKQQEKHKLESQLIELRNEGQQEKDKAVRELENQLRVIASDIKNDESEVESNNRAVSNNNLRINKLEAENKALRTDWETENKRELVIDEHAFDCPTCKQKLPEGNAEELREKLTTSFNNVKAQKMKMITENGGNNKKEIDRLRKSNETFETDTIIINNRIKEARVKLDTLYTEKTKAESAPVEIPTGKVTLLEKQIADFIIPDSPKIDNSELKSKKLVINGEIDSLRQVLSTKDQIEKLNARIEELEKEEQKLSQELADLEKTEFTIDAFSKAKIETIEARINGKFKIVKFKMFEQQINGGEVECCECMVNGVPYSDVNTAGRIQAGIDIINALTEHYGANAPVWIDNRESVIRIPECKSQIINLRAVKNAKLTVTVEETEEVMAS